jgi:protein O-GlcNAc transferase
MSVKTTPSATFSRIKYAYRQAWKGREFEKAEKQAVLMTRRHPNYAYSWRSLGAARVELKRPAEALEALAEATRLEPNDDQGFYWLGSARFALKDWNPASRELQQCLALNPRHAAAHALLARVYSAQGLRDQAMESIDIARSLDPASPEILTQRINIFSAARRMEDVLADCQRLLELDSSNPSFYNLVATKYCEMTDFARGAHYFEEALKRRPDYLEAFSNRIFNAHYDPFLSRQHIAALIQRWRASFSPAQRPRRPEGGGRDEGRRLTVGLLSAGLRMHPVGQMITSALENLSADDFRLTVYSTSDLQDVLTARMRAVTEKWHNVAGQSDAGIEALLRQDQVDILIDLSGHTDGNRLQLVAREPAPLIVKWVGGLVNTTGLDAIDYLISDAVETPPGCDADYLEKLIRMPDDYICYVPPEHAPPVGTLPAAGNGYVTFGCLNNPAKVNPHLIGEWARLLAELPGSRLLLKSGQYSDAAFRERLWSEFEAAGVERERILLEGPDHHIAFLDTYNRIDIALDPWPYSGGLTTCEALLMGVPVITLPGPTFAGRHAASHLVNAGLPELVVDNWDAYRARARDLAGDLDNLATVRRHLRDTLLQSPVCDARRFAAHLSAALRGIWQRYCRDLPPAALTFGQDSTGQFEDQALPVPEPVTPTLTLAKAAARREDAGQFHFDFSGKIVALDNGGQLLETGAADSLLSLGAFELLVFEPLGQQPGEANRQRDDFQIFSHTTLGDGKPATHYACLDPEFSATLKPLEEAGDGGRVLTTLPVSTVALDSIKGLPNLDWLLLDDRHDSLAILQHGREALRDTLAIHARVAFRPTHHGQPTLEHLCAWAADSEFQLYRIDKLTHHSHFAGTMDQAGQATELKRAELLFIPTPARRDAMSPARRQRLAFLLHTVYNIRDLSYTLLMSVDPERAEQYLSGISKIDGAQQAVISPLSHNVSHGKSAVPNTSDWFATSLKLLQANRPLRPRDHNLAAPLVVSLTSYPARFQSLVPTLYSLLSQTIKPDRIIVWIAHSDREALTKALLSFETKGVEFRFCEDLNSYKKVIPALEAFPDSYLATADDDLYYWPTWLEELVDATSGGSQEIIAHRVHRISLTKAGQPMSYQDWTWNHNDTSGADSLNFATNGAGTLFPPGCFHPEVTRREIFECDCPDADDIWLYWMIRMAGWVFKPTGSTMKLVVWPGSQKQTLFSTNGAGGNDTQIGHMLRRYGSVFSAAKRHPFSVGAYWEQRYRRGGNSGSGSYGRLAYFKAEVLNEFISENKVEDIIEFGCGDGHQTSLLENTSYLGVDISPTAIEQCRKRFETDSSKRFMELKAFTETPRNATLTLSLDVIYHLVDDEIYYAYMRDLFDYANRFCIVYSANVEEMTPDIHVRKRKFTEWVEQNRPQWKLIKHLPNRYPTRPGRDPNETSFADFYFFARD